MSEALEIPVKIGDETPESGFQLEVERLSGQKIPDCYQCGMCTAGCPVAFAMDLAPNQVMRMVQLGLADSVLRSHTIWLCAGCETCATRCPKLVELSKVMDVLRQIAVQRGIKCPEPEVEAFHKSFLLTLEQMGRVHEMGMIALMKIKTRKFLKDMPVGIKLFLKGKLSPMPNLVKDRKGIKAIFTHSKQRRRRS